MLFADAPHILFRLLNEGTLQIQEQRWGSFVTQGTALLAGKAGLPLKMVMMIYSASFNLFFLAVILALILRHRRPGLALVFALYLLLLTSETFYWSNNEVHQGIGWLMLLAGEHSLGVSRGRPSWLRTSIFVLLAALAFWTHPLVMLAAGYLWVFFLVYEGGKCVGRTAGEKVLLTILLAAIAAAKYYIAHHFGWYDSEKLKAVDGLSLRSIPTAFSSAAAAGFYRGIGRESLVFCVAFLAGMAALLRARQWMLAGLTLVNALGFFFIVAHVHGAGFARFYIESQWMPMTFSASVPLVLYALPMMRRAAAVALLATLCIIQSGWILWGSRPFRDRLSYTSEILADMRERGVFKAHLPEPDEAVRSRLKLWWGASVESMMQSALDGESPQRTFAFHPEPEKASDGYGKHTMDAPWDYRSSSKLNPRYFRLDTTQTYQLLR